MDLSERRLPELRKAGCKKQDHCYSKREEAVWLLKKTYFGPHFPVPDPKKIPG